ncbi:MAG: hypothetical protein HUU33_15060 [Flavobacteriales bacterium]|nr:hypothetical protein [Flavobacteriales bacterium]
MRQESIAEIIARLADPWKPTRNEAAELLAARGSEVIEPLRAILLADDPDPDLAHYALWVLDQIDDPAASDLAEAYWEKHG